MTVVLNFVSLHSLNIYLVIYNYMFKLLHIVVIYLFVCLITLITEADINLSYEAMCDTLRDMMIKKNDMRYVSPYGNYALTARK